MNVLLDNCVHRAARTFFPGHRVRTAFQAGLARAQNGDLFTAAAAASFDVLVTTDKNIAYQHHLPDLPLAVIELSPTDTRIDGLRPLAPLCPAALAATTDHLFVRVHPDGRLDTLAPRVAPS